MAKPWRVARSMIRDYWKNISTYISGTSEADIKEQVYAETAAREILDSLYKHPDIPPLVLLEEYRNLMDEYSTRSLTNSWLYSVKKDTAQFFIDSLMR